MMVPSSNWLGHHPFKVKIASSNLVGTTMQIVYIRLTSNAIMGFAKTNSLIVVLLHFYREVAKFIILLYLFSGSSSVHKSYFGKAII